MGWVNKINSGSCPMTGFVISSVQPFRVYHNVTYLFSMLVPTCTHMSTISNVRVQ